MERIYLDLFFSGITYVIITYLAFRLMKKRGVKRDRDDDDKGNFEIDAPIIDLPPGVVWPDSPLLVEEQSEKIL